jgi:peroxiredoxin (alkyl hydroperoxide reductase subunit C)
MLTIGDHLPAYSLKGVISNDLKTAFQTYTDQDDQGKWKIYFFWPKDFTFVCPTEIIGFSELYPEFQNRGCQVYGVSTDSEFVHLAWRNHHPGLKTLPFPMLSDLKRELSEALGILHKKEGVCLRATFIVDPDNVIRFVSVNDLSVGRNPEEVLRVLDGLQCGELTPCNWQRGQDVIKVA